MIGAISLMAILVFLFFYEQKNEVAYRLTAQELVSEFDESEGTASSIYAGKKIAVTGAISEINADKGIVWLGINGSNQIGCTFDRSSFPKDISAGNEVTITGVCAGKLMEIQIIQCEIL